MQTNVASLGWKWVLIAICTCVVARSSPAAEGTADLILHNGKVATVDGKFSIVQAIAVRGEQVIKVGTNDDVLKTKGEKTKLIDLGGKLVLPGLIDSHVHPGSASMHEFDHPVPDMETIDDVLKYIRARAEASAEGEWVSVSQIFITRLKEQRYPTKAELDAAAPRNPVVFATGPDASVNSLALKASGIDKDFKVEGTGYLEKDPKTGEPTGILRDCSRYLKVTSRPSKATENNRDERLKTLIADYNSVGITSIADRDCGSGGVARYLKLHQAGELNVRVAISHSVNGSGKLDSVREAIRGIARHPLARPDPRLRIVGIKTYLDGGMLTGSAYMRQPWGVSDIYSIRDPLYRGILKIPQDQLNAIVLATVESGLQFTAHSVGDGAVHNLLDAYAAANRVTPVRPTRPCITHCNFMSREAVEQMVELGVVCDIQPAWLYLDARTLMAQFGYDRLRYFQPLKTIFELGAVAGGGSDHMQKIGSFRSINPYNPFLGMSTTITRQGKSLDKPLHPEEALSRQQAIRFYTANNAFIAFLDQEIGSLEAGKRADMIVLDRDLLECPVEQIKDAQVLSTYLDGKLVYERK